MKRYSSIAYQHGRIVTFPDQPFRKFRVLSCYWDRQAEAYQLVYAEVPR